MNLKIDFMFLTNEFQLNKDSNYEKTNTDVVVKLKSGEKYIATFFNYDNMEELRKKHQETGEYLSGKYFRVDNMVLVESCSKACIREVVEYLIDEGDFNQVFKKI